MKPIYHGTVIQGLKLLKPQKRFTPGGANTADAIPPRIYATYTGAFAVAHSFPWSSEDGIDVQSIDGVIHLFVPKERQSVLNQAICVYALPDDTFVHTDEEETALTYHSLTEVVPLSSECFGDVADAMKAFGGIITLV